MKKLISVLALVIAATGAQASTANVQLIAKNNTAETNLCLVAAQQGYNAVVAKVRGDKKQLANLASTKCNGESIKDFAHSFNAEKPVEVHNSVVVVSDKQSLESQLCMKALNEGVRAVGHTKWSLKCNGQSVENFVKSVKRSL